MSACVQMGRRAMDLINSGDIWLPITAIFVFVVVYIYAKRRPKTAIPSPWPTIEPLRDFIWDTIEPTRIRPFKPLYHLSMGVVRSDPSNLIRIDRDHYQRIMHRRDLMAQYPEHTLAARPRSIHAVHEIYEWLMTQYLPTRYPTIFQLRKDKLYCTITDEIIPTTVNDQCKSNTEAATAALRTLSGLIDLDILILLPSPAATGPKYHLEAFGVCFPSGFNTRKKLGLPLAAIHEPVPRYSEKLEKSMDRYFERLEVGKWVQRANWTITTHDKLFMPGDEGESNHLRPGEEIPTSKKEINLEKCHLRIEDQKLFRMPKSKAIVFAFKTYLTPLWELKEKEGREMAGALAEAIEGMRKGNVPEVWLYKRGFEWSDKVVEYLRS